jgi:DNA-binding response OmpR family regulator
MIVIISGSAPERAAFSALCGSRGWPCTECESVRAAKKTLNQLHPRVVVTRHKLADGYSDDVLTALGAPERTPSVRVIVLIGASAAGETARQLALGADSVHRDPVRADVLLEYLAKYRRPTVASRNSTAKPQHQRTFHLAGAAIDPIDRHLKRGRRHTALTPREVQLAELLFESRNEVVTYDTLFSEILGRRFQGDTSNMRVLLGKLDGSFRSVGLAFRQHVEVIAKTGYRYTTPSPRRPTR